MRAEKKGSRRSWNVRLLHDGHVLVRSPLPSPSTSCLTSVRRLFYFLLPLLSCVWSDGIAATGVKKKEEVDLTTTATPAAPVPPHSRLLSAYGTEREKTNSRTTVSSGIRNWQSFLLLSVRIKKCAGTKKSNRSKEQTQEKKRIIKWRSADLRCVRTLRPKRCDF